MVVMEVQLLWDDYDTKFLSDPTGSYLTTYVSTIGIYDKDGDMVHSKITTTI